MEYGKTASGKPLTDELIDQLADKAEAGFVDEAERRRMKVWYCKIGEVRIDLLPDDADRAMRDAVEGAYFDLAGNNEFIFSGWGAQLTEAERAVVEDREPDMAAVVREACAGLPWDTLREAVAAALKEAHTRWRAGDDEASVVDSMWHDHADAALAVLREGRV